MIKESDNESDNESVNESVNKSNNKSNNESNNKSDNKSVNKSDNKSVNKSTTKWYDENKLNEKILTTIDSNFNHENKIGTFNVNDINDLINNIKNNTISESDTKKKTNELNKIKNVEIKGRRLIENQEKLLSLLDDLKTIFNNNNNSNNNESDSNNKNENENDEYYYEIRQLNDWFKTIDQTKSLEEQIELLKERGEFLSEYWYVGYYHDNKELNYKIFKAKAAYVLNDIADNSFEKIFGCKFATLVDKLINTTSKEENQIIIEDIENNRDKIFEEYKFDKSVIKQRGNLYDAVKIILEISELLTLGEDIND